MFVVFIDQHGGACSKLQDDCFAQLVFDLLTSFASACFWMYKVVKALPGCSVATSLQPLQTIFAVIGLEQLACSPCPIWEAAPSLIIYFAAKSQKSLIALVLYRLPPFSTL